MNDGPDSPEFTDLAIAPPYSNPSLQRTIGFWVGLASLSILIHLLGFWASREWGLQSSPEQTPQPIPVSILETPVATGLTTPEAIAPPLSQPAQPVQPPAPSAVPTQPPAQRSPSSPPTGPSITSIPGPAIPPSVPDESESPQPDLPTLEPDSTAPPGADADSDTSSADVPVLDGGPSLPALPDGATADPAGDRPVADPSLPSVAISGDQPAPAQYLLELEVVPMSPEVATPESTGAAAVPQPVETEIIFTADPRQSICQITPDMEADLGTPVLMQARIDAGGQVVEVQPMVAIAPDPSASPDAEAIGIPQPDQSPEPASAYQQFAQCVLQEWTFTVPNGGAGPVSDTVLVRLTVNRAP